MNKLTYMIESDKVFWRKIKKYNRPKESGECGAEVGVVYRIKRRGLGKSHWEAEIWTKTCKSEEIGQAAPWGKSSPESVDD